MNLSRIARDRDCANGGDDRPRTLAKVAREVMLASGAGLPSCRLQMIFRAVPEIEE